MTYNSAIGDFREHTFRKLKRRTPTPLFLRARCSVTGHIKDVRKLRPSAFPSH